MRLRHIVFLACIAALLSLASCAVADDAGHGGHVNPNAYVNRTPAVTYEPTPQDIVVTLPDGTPIVVQDVESFSPAPDDFAAENILLPSATINRISVQTALTVTITEPGLADVAPVVGNGAEPVSADITLKNYPTDGAKTNLYAFIRPQNEMPETVGQAEDESGDITLDPEKYYYFPATLDGTELSFTLDNPDAFFQSGVSNDVIIAEAKTVPSSSGSSGCNAGFAGLLLLAAVPLICLRGRK